MKRSILVLGVLALLPVQGEAAETGGFGVACAGLAADDTVKIAVASTGPAADATISQEAASAPYILIFDQEGELVDTVENRGLPAQRAGAQVALALKERGAAHYIAGRFGENLIRALDEAGIKRVEKTGPAREAVKQVIGEPSPS